MESNSRPKTVITKEQSDQLVCISIVEFVTNNIDGPSWDKRKRESVRKEKGPTVVTSVGKEIGF